MAVGSPGQHQNIADANEAQESDHDGIYLRKIDDDLSVGLRLLEEKDTLRDTQKK